MLFAKHAYTCVWHVLAVLAVDLSGACLSEQPLLCPSAALKLESQEQPKAISQRFPSAPFTVSRGIDQLTMCTKEKCGTSVSLQLLKRPLLLE